MKYYMYRGINWWIIAICITIIFVVAFVLYGTRLEPFAGVIGLIMAMPGAQLAATKIIRIPDGPFYVERSDSRETWFVKGKPSETSSSEIVTYFEGKKGQENALRYVRDLNTRYHEDRKVLGD